MGAAFVLAGDSVVGQLARVAGCYHDFGPCRGFVGPGCVGCSSFAAGFVGRKLALGQQVDSKVAQVLEQAAVDDMKVEAA